MDQSRYSRYGGFRREEGQPFMAQFGYGGAGYGGFGRKGKYGGWRSYYNYGQPMRHEYDVRGNYPSVNMNPNVIHPTWHKPTFVFAMFIIAVLLLGLYIGNKSKVSSSEYYF